MGAAWVREEALCGGVGGAEVEGNGGVVVVCCYWGGLRVV